MVSRRTNRDLAQKRGRRGTAFFFLWESFQERRVCANGGEGYRMRNKKYAASTAPILPQATGKKSLQDKALFRVRSLQDTQEGEHRAKAEHPQESLDLEETGEANAPHTTCEGTVSPSWGGLCHPPPHSINTTPSQVSWLLQLSIQKNRMGGTAPRASLLPRPPSRSCQQNVAT